MIHTDQIIFDPKEIIFARKSESKDPRTNEVLFGIEMLFHPGNDKSKIYLHCKDEKKCDDLLNLISKELKDAQSIKNIPKRSKRSV